MKAPPGSADRAELVRAGHGRVRGCLIGLAAICLLIPVIAGASYALDALVDAPWAYARFGRPTLTGTWEGEFDTPTGTHFVVFMELTRKLLSGREPHNEDYQGELMAGQAMWCDDHGRHAEQIPIEGAVPLFSGYDGSANQVEMNLQSEDHQQQGLLPDALAGNWKADTLMLQPTFVFWDGSNFVSSSRNADLTTQITVVLKKADQNAFRAACAKLGNAAP